MELFLKRSRGSITVLVTLILVPTIFFTGFLTDLSRLKLCGNQAVMAADNYGETVLTQYDNLLKELYGLFAVTQNEDGLKALDDLQAYMKTSFDPSSNGINWNHLEAIQDFAGMNEVEGFMPYRSAKVEMSYEFPENANLGDNVVLAIQVGDFMRFRIAEQLLEDNTDLLDMLETVSNMEEDSKVIKKKTELDEKIDKLFEKINVNHYQRKMSVIAFASFDILEHLLLKISVVVEFCQTVSRSKSIRVFQISGFHDIFCKIAGNKHQKN